jgi:hypothetical protein
MPISTNGQICFGIMFKDDDEFPWNTEEYNYDLETWWIKLICGYKPPFEIYVDEEGTLLKDVSQDKKEEYWLHLREFKKLHPVPIEEISCCHWDDPMYILAVSRTYLCANRGSPEEFNPADLTVSKEEIQKLMDFIKKYLNLNEIPEPKWYLSSYYG